MADVKVNKESSQQGRGGQQQQSQQSEGGGGGLQRRGQGMPGFLSLSPRELFSMSPFHMMRRLSEDIDRIFTGRELAEAVMWVPPVEVRQEGDNLLVHVELAGLTPDDVQVEITDDGLVISGERRREREEERGGYYRSERMYGRFSRVIPLPDNANTDQVSATFNNGVLEITVPVAQAEEKRRQVPVQAQQGGAQAAGGGSQTRTSGGGAGA